MFRFAIKLMMPAIFTVALVASPAGVPVFAAGGGGGGGGGGGDLSDVMNPKPPNTKAAPASQSTHRTKKSAKQSFLSNPAFVQGYRDAYATIYERNDYTSAIERLKALGHDDYANVANLIGYSYRKLGN